MRSFTWSGGATWSSLFFLFTSGITDRTCKTRYWAR